MLFPQKHWGPVSESKRLKVPLAFLMISISVSLSVCKQTWALSSLLSWHWLLQRGPSTLYAELSGQHWASGHSAVVERHRGAERAAPPLRAGDDDAAAQRSWVHQTSWGAAAFFCGDQLSDIRYVMCFQVSVMCTAICGSGSIIITSVRE